MEYGQQPVWRSVGLLGRSADGPGLGPGNCEKRLLWAASLLCVLLDLQLPAMGKFKSALPDLSKAIELKPDFLAARLQRGNILLKQGYTQEAKQDFEAVLKSNPDDAEAQNQLSRVTEQEFSMQEAQTAFQKKNYLGAVSFLDRVIEISPWDPEPKELRSECYLHLGNYNKAIMDLKPTTKLRNDNRAAFLKLSKLYYNLGEHEESLTNIFILRDRAEAFILNEEFEKAIEDYQEAKEFDAENEELKDGLERAQKLLKQSKKRNYYKILGIQRNANKQEIIKAYRKLAQQWHPDNFQSEDEKKEAEKKFIDIAAAKETRKINKEDQDISTSGRPNLTPLAPGTFILSFISINSPEPPEDQYNTLASELMHKEDNNNSYTNGNRGREVSFLIYIFKYPFPDEWKFVPQDSNQDHKEDGDLLLLAVELNPCSPSKHLSSSLLYLQDLGSSASPLPRKQFIFKSQQGKGKACRFEFTFPKESLAGHVDI
ncbi:DnaJ-like subfamily C member 3 [Ophiophagus hannah]|uniref:DnaJ-like subfamily C member 3 n=1 Tax=Ophiophagus hannah TaxID=8665 RepID=V8P5J4_OPHHA|nr:DnaJ-like subfamily C member 3 [Ophiophagus hannah]